MIFSKLYYTLDILFNCCRNKKNIQEQEDNNERVFNILHKNDLFYWHNIYKNNNSLT